MYIIKNITILVSNLEYTYALCAFINYFILLVVI